MSNNVFRNIPSVTELLENPAIKQVVDRVNHHVVVHEVRGFLDRLRDDLRTATEEITVPTPTIMAETIARWIVAGDQQRLRPVINATGILLHTGLGRAPLAKEAIAAMSAVSSGYASLELDLETGKRGQRIAAVDRLLIELTGAEAAAVVNNNAAATLLTLSAVAAHRQVIVSRGQLVEIGGSYRLPEVMQASGATLKEVGTTNRTRIADYEQAVGPETAAIMRVHPSNYRVVGFTESASLKELVALGRKTQLPVIDDVGSGALIDMTRFGLHDEPVISASIEEGADLVLFSGDKLLGGPQCGIIVGKRKFVEIILAHPLMRAMRVGKATLAALEATLRLYREPDKMDETIPLLSLLSTSFENLQGRAQRMVPQCVACAAIAEAEAIEDTTQVGGGSLPGQNLPTYCVALRPQDGSVDELARRLRTGNPSVVGRVSQDRLLLDLRSVRPDEDMLIVQRLSSLKVVTP